MKKKCIILAGGYSQIFLIKEVKSRGIHTILADNNINAVAKPYADEFVKVNILDFEAVKKIAIEKKVDYIVTACADQVLLTMAKVSEDLGLPTYIDYKTACLVSDKKYMKQRCKEYGIPTSDFVIINSLDYSSFEHLKYPLVFKPVDGYSAKGISKVYSKGEVEEAFNYAFSAARTKEIVVEEFVEGREVTIDVYVDDGKANVLSISNTEKLPFNDLFLAFRTWYPATIPNTVVSQIEDAAQKIADAYNLKNTPMLIQMIIAEDKISVLEFCARTGGGAKYTLLERASGFDPFKTVVDLTLGIKPIIRIQQPQNKFISNLFIYGNNGIIEKYEGFKELLEDGIISDYCIFKWKGAEIKQIKTSSDRLCSITVQDDSLEQMKVKFEKAISKIKVLSNTGEDMIRRDLIQDIPYVDYNGYIEWFK